MQILLSCAKTIQLPDKVVKVPFTSTPLFEQEAKHFAMELSNWNVSDFERELQCSEKIAKENKSRYLRFFDHSTGMPAILAYNGQAYKIMDAKTFSDADFRFAQAHLWMTSFLYGLLRPLDVIRPYRLEGKVRLMATEGQSMFNYWKAKLTDKLIEATLADDGILVHLATEEMEHLFDWEKVQEKLTIVQPKFLVHDGNKLKLVTVYAKSCRGGMTRFIIQHKLRSIRRLSEFEYNGFLYNQNMSDKLNPYFIVES